MNTQVIEILPNEAFDLFHNEGAALLDTRDIRDFSMSHADGAIHLNPSNFNEVIDDLDFDDPIIIICHIGKSSLHTAAYLVEQGYERVYSVKGGFEAWKSLNLPMINNK